ncbi:hypothetical protein [Streptomyces sp. VRA16 Mangrove soil]|uniref:hypothetical protein n=1 Tax=Streptomyces sp. VRA16 Mangrove soil TaxID=2817434 RepID=UPI001A9D1AE8|nr:hypothetical protein [Streptomyces sp. VRA16 Mangrove soil]MBO1330789.1 hypothetical protein [Streptomyces sp. VRA16 Mangrove soil]
MAICGSGRGALTIGRSLIGDLGGRAAVAGGLDSARQRGEAAGCVMRVVASGHAPRCAVPDADPAPVGARRSATN